ncbi:MAG: helix-turn-helix transcriptional regulator [Methylobacter sp.]
MTGDDKLDHLISVLYETVLDPSRWREAVGLCGQYAGGIDGQLCTANKESLIPTDFVLAGTAFSLQAGDAYADYYLPSDPRIPMILDAAVNEWRCCHHFFDQNFVDHNEFYQDFLIPYGARYGMVAIVDDNYDRFTTFASIRAVGQQPFDDTNQLAAQRFSGHLQRVLRLQRHTQGLQTKAELGARAIDALALSMLIVDAKGAILHLNADAERLLNCRASGLTSKAGLLSIADPSNKNRLEALIAMATGYPAVGGAMFLSGEKIRQVFVTPLPAASPFAQDWQNPLVLVLVTESGKNLSALQLIGTLYDLTPVELRVASALLAGKSLEEYALEASVTMNTVRTQMKSLFSKTGTHRQSELMSILSQAPPLHN